MEKKTFLRNEYIWVMRKCLVIMVTSNAILKNRTAPTKSIISAAYHRLLNSYKIKGLTYVFQPMARDTDINENLRKKGKS